MKIRLSEYSGAQKRRVCLLFDGNRVETRFKIVVQHHKIGKYEDVFKLQLINCGVHIHIPEPGACFLPRWLRRLCRWFWLGLLARPRVIRTIRQLNDDRFRSLSLFFGWLCWGLIWWLLTRTWVVWTKYKRTCYNE
jgi:hypothetical protein